MPAELRELTGGGAYPLHVGRLHYQGRRLYRACGHIALVTPESSAASWACARAIARAAFTAGELEGPNLDAGWEVGRHDPEGRLVGSIWLKASGCPVAYIVRREADGRPVCWWITRDNEALALVMAELLADEGYRPRLLA